MKLCAHGSWSFFYDNTIEAQRAPAEVGLKLLTFISMFFLEMQLSIQLSGESNSYPEGKSCILEVFS